MPPINDPIKDPQHPDIAPETLANVGKASVLQDMVDETKGLRDQGKGLVTVFTQESARTAARWKRAAIAFGIGMALLLLNDAVTQYRSWFVTGPKIDNTNSIVDKIDQSNINTDEIVAYVHRLETAQAAQCLTVTTPQQVESCKNLGFPTSSTTTIQPAEGG